MHRFEETLCGLAKRSTIMVVEAETPFDTLLAARVLRKHMPAMSPFEKCYLDQTRAVAEMVGTLAADEYPPLRAPHYTVGGAALAGRHGGSLRHAPGEADLAAGGILLLEEFDRFRLSALRLLGEELPKSIVSPMVVAAVHSSDEGFSGDYLDRCLRALKRDQEVTHVVLPTLTADERDEIHRVL